MKDETYVFIQDVREKKITARSARNTRTHNGKRGAVKLPSDYMTKKELNAMNGEVQSYRLNSPMTFVEFKSLPDDLKVMYIKLIRNRFHAPDKAIGKMLGVSQKTISLHLADLGCSAGKGKNHPNWDKEGFLAWCNGAPVPAASAPAREERATAIPCSGSMTFEGSADVVLNTAAVLLGGANVHICITWEVCPEDVGVDHG